MFRQVKKKTNNNVNNNINIITNTAAIASTINNNICNNNYSSIIRNEFFTKKRSIKSIKIIKSFRFYSTTNSSLQSNNNQNIANNINDNSNPNSDLYEAFEPLTDNIDLSSSSTVAGDNISVLTETAMKIGDLKALGLVNSTPVGFIEGLLETLHVTSGLSWFSTIVAATFLLRMAFLPFLISSQRHVAKFQKIQPEFNALNDQLKIAKESNNPARSLELKMEIIDLYKKHNVSPFKGLLTALVQAPTLLCFFLALRNISKADVPDLKTGGILWFQDLSSPDPYYVLPVLATASFFIGLRTAPASSPNLKYANFFRALTLVSLPIGITLPSAIIVHLISSTVIGTIQTIILNNEDFRRSVDLPVLEKQPKDLFDAKSIATSYNPQKKNLKGRKVYPNNNISH
ncbi:17777_t:CDS:2 [Entrophospora sp. SA101]|nr:9428_t:CDS:2 [Entrophospora sp. SA101]CAJ0769297.1 17770_t:CDS:2 [Entrophospora sp. SA101]CAJ0769304.1 17777_t:CDS:2 [Entrophospora sp. SA101]